MRSDDKLDLDCLLHRQAGGRVAFEKPAALGIEMPLSVFMRINETIE
jgi:hypothetical protein